MWALVRDGRIVGTTCLYESSPEWFWTPEERAVPAFAGQGIGHLMLRRVLDHAARTGKEWVRRGTFEPGLVRYYTQVQGWQIVREKSEEASRWSG